LIPRRQLSVVSCQLFVVGCELLIVTRQTVCPSF